MTTREIHDLIQTTDLVPDEDSMGNVLLVLEALNEKVGALEAELMRVANASSCAANGIIPD